MTSEKARGLLIPIELASIRSKADLLTLAEALDIETYEVKRTTFIYLDENEDAWFGQVKGKRKQDVTVEDVKSSLNRVPDTIFPRIPSTLTMSCEGKSPANYYTKLPKLLLLDDKEEAKLLPQMLLDEIQVLELINHYPHPNIIQYYGCRVKNGRVRGILLEKHKTLLQHRHHNRSVRHDVAACLSGIRAGVEHLHSIGLAHNDLNPSNILLNENDEPVIIDFGSCRRFGERLVSAGTPGWTEEDYEVSEQRNDETALTKIEARLKDRAGGINLCREMDDTESIC